MRHLRRIAIVTVMTVVAASGAQSQPAETYVPPNGFVPDASTASRIAEAVSIPIYGEPRVAAQKPFKVTLGGDTWTVTGKGLPPGTFGGVLQVEISKQDGRILRITHGR